MLHARLNKMKILTKTLLTISVILISLSAQAQKQDRVALSYGFGNGNFGSFLKGGSGNSYSQKSLNIFGLNFWHGLSKHLIFETGMQLIRYDYTTTYINGTAPTNNTLNIISVPFKFRLEAGDFIFINGGFSADFGKGKQDGIGGIGAGIGVGLQFKIIKEISFYINPQANVHSVIPLRSLFAESNITFGLAYPLN